MSKITDIDKDIYNDLIPRRKNGPRCHIDREKLEAAFDKVIGFHRNSTNDPHDVSPAVYAALIEVKAALLESLS